MQFSLLASVPLPVEPLVWETFLMDTHTLVPEKH